MFFNIFALASAGGGAHSGGFSGGGGFDVGNIQLPGLLDFAEIFASWLKALAGFWNALNVPLGELFAAFDDSWLGGLPNFDHAFDTGLPAIIRFLGLSDVTLLGLILGGALGFYVTYQLIVWLLNIIT